MELGEQMVVKGEWRRTNDQFTGKRLESKWEKTAAFVLRRVTLCEACVHLTRGAGLSLVCSGPQTRGLATAPQSLSCGCSSWTPRETAGRLPGPWVAELRRGQWLLPESEIGPWLAGACAAMGLVPPGEEDLRWLAG